MMVRGRLLRVDWSGQTTRAASAVFDISVASVVKWTQRVRVTGSAAAKPMGGKRPFLLEAERDWLLARLDQKPDLTLHALRERGVCVSCDRLCHFLKRQEISFKKNLVRRRAGSSRRRPAPPPLEEILGPD